MFVQDDVVLNVDFFYFLFFLVAAACTTITTSHCRPLCSAVCLFEQTGCEETKVNKEIMFWPSIVDALLHEADCFFFLENELLERMP